MEIMHLRQTRSDNTHLAYADKVLACGTVADTWRTATPAAGLESGTTCSSCRRVMGWPTAPGSHRQRTTSGLDSSAWGANRGR